MWWVQRVSEKIRIPYRRLYSTHISPHSFLPRMCVALIQLRLNHWNCAFHLACTWNRRINIDKWSSNVLGAQSNTWNIYLLKMFAISIFLAFSLCSKTKAVKIPNGARIRQIQPNAKYINKIFGLQEVFYCSSTSLPRHPPTSHVVSAYCMQAACAKCECSFEERARLLEIEVNSNYCYYCWHYGIKWTAFQFVQLFM